MIVGVLRRLLTVLLGVLVGTALSLGPAMASANITISDYVYDGHHAPAEFADSASERGPPTAADRSADYDASDRGSIGASVWPESGAIYGYTTYDPRVQLVQASGPDATTHGRAEAIDGASVTLQTGRVAANGGDDLLRLSTKDSWGRLDTLDDHFMRHGADFGAASADDYARMASEFYQTGLKSGLPTKLDPKTGVVRIYDPATNTFGSFNPSGTTKTFYKPDPASHGFATNWDYWVSQPGYAP